MTTLSTFPVTVTLTVMSLLLAPVPAAGSIAAGATSLLMKVVGPPSPKVSVAAANAPAAVAEVSRRGLVPPVVEVPPGPPSR